MSYPESLLDRVVSEGVPVSANIKEDFYPRMYWMIPLELLDKIVGVSSYPKPHMTKPLFDGNLDTVSVHVFAMSNRLFTVYEFIVEYLGSNGYPPTIREICLGCNISSTSMVSYYLDKLEGEQLIIRTKFKARGIKVL